jgi:hypothetical protein
MRLCEAPALRYLMSTNGENGRALRAERALTSPKLLSKAHWRWAVIGPRISRRVTIRRIGLCFSGSQKMIQSDPVVGTRAA